MKTPLFKYSLLVLVVTLLHSCERELERYELLTFERCETEDVVPDPFVVTDFECQSNVNINGVEVIRNPSETGDNLSRFVGEYTDGASATDALVIEFDDDLDLSTNATLSFAVKTDVTGTLEIQLLGDPDGTVSYEVIIAGNERWIEYEVDLVDDRDKSFDQINFVFNSGIENNGNDIYLIDNIKFELTIDPCEDVVADLSIISDFECQQNYFLGADPEQTSVEPVDNPFIGGINQSSDVGRYVDNGTEAFDNLQINFDDAIDLSEKPLFTMKVYAPTPGILTVKLEGGSEAVEQSATVTTANQWVEYSFNFADAVDNDNDTMIIFFNAGSMDGNEAEVYFIDDLQFEEFVDPCESVDEDLSIISDFECQQNYTLGVNPALISTIENFDPDDVNMSDLIGQYSDDGTQGFDNLLIDFEDDIDLSERPVFSIKVYSTQQAPLVAKVEGGDTPLEIAREITAVNEWVEYTFDFSPVADQGNDQLILFFNFGQEDGTTTDLYYIDDLRFVENPCGVIDEDCENVTPDLTIISDFNCQQNYHLGAVPTVEDAPVVPNPDVSCENRSANVGRYTDNGTDPFDNLFIDLEGPFDLTNNSTLRLKILSDNPAPVPVLAKLEGGTPLEVFADVTVTGEWTEISFDFSAAIGAGNDALVLFVNAGETNTSTADIYYLDDIRFEAP
ncbi:carbohydrate binding domain-containing protein [Nonlabens ponticola]|uniref:CBM-cenC domain-containing protein n=1 Tax=Nonlabens ponticola TaxID=2496866 RepID=A0A3S9MUI7_9FLAO|nr:hypothetical protein [Nonlabens ponticola]AZQ42846.1 hypothetical protein EJ995_00810 [Nonlabens ponticola]